jgi:glycosyltransferase involved in cell wall biosynthesis
MARLLAPAATAARGLPTVVTLHNLMEAVPFHQLGVRGSPFHRTAGRFATAMQFRAHTTCFTLQRYVELAQAHYRASNAVHVPHHVFADPRRSSVPEQATRLLYFGLNAPFKGLEVLLDAVDRCAAAIPGLTLYVAGGTHPRFPENRARGQSRHGCVHYLGEVSDARAAELMAAAHVLVAPNLATSGASSVIHRAVAYGKAVIASDLPDFRALVEEEGMSIEFCDPGNAAQLAKAIRRLCSDFERRSRASDANLAAAARLTPTAIAGTYLKVFQAAVAAGARAPIMTTAQPDLLAA